jgi:hypothetical protein
VVRSLLGKRVSFHRSGGERPTSEKKVIGVVGATGVQGGELVRAILADFEGPFVARAVTRKLESEKSLGARQAWRISRGRRRADDSPSLDRAFAGAYGAFCVTNFWEHLSAEREGAQATAMARATRKAAHLAHLNHVSAKRYPLGNGSSGSTLKLKSSSPKRWPSLTCSLLGDSVRTHVAQGNKPVRVIRRHRDHLRIICSAVRIEGTTMRVGCGRGLAHCAEQVESGPRPEGGGRGKKTKRMQMYITACNPDAIFEPFFSAKQALQNRSQLWSATRQTASYRTGGDRPVASELARASPGATLRPTRAVWTRVKGQ